MVTDILDDIATKYETMEHVPAYSAQRLAQAEHTKGMNVAKPVVVKADDRDYMCILPGCCKIDFDALSTVLGVERVELVSEQYMAGLFPDCEVGAEPPFGSFYGLPSVMDDRLVEDDFIVFQAGSHDRAIKMSLSDFLRIEQPRVAAFSYCR